jgi:predicted RNA-binding Zn ribbon-like protein
MDSLRFDVTTLFAGGRLCLDFINTYYHLPNTELELIGNSDELRQWLRQAEDALAMSLCPDDTIWEAGYGEQILPRAIELRTALRRLIESVLNGSPVSGEALETINSVLRENPAYTRIENSPEGFREVATVSPLENRWLVEIARDAIRLLCHSDLSLLRQCDCPTCIRVFYDTTKNHKRRWCVEKCGSKPKAAAYYRRKIAKAGAGK